VAAVLSLEGEGFFAGLFALYWQMTRKLSSAWAYEEAGRCLEDIVVATQDKPQLIVKDHKIRCVVLSAKQYRALVAHDEAYDAFVKMLDAPAEPSDALKALMARKPAWQH
jgi:uncharacterized protein (DUF1778 family)